MSHLVSRLAHIGRRSQEALAIGRSASHNLNRPLRPPYSLPEFMRLKFFLAIALLTVCVNIPQSSKAQEPASLPFTILQLDEPPGWFELSSEEGQFAIAMPGRPKFKSETFAEQYVNYLFKFSQNKDRYLVRYFDLRSSLSATTMKITLDSVVSSLVVGANAKLVEQHDISFKGYPARGFTFQPISSKEPPGVGQVILVDRRIYTIVVSTPQPENAQKFLESFRLLLPPVETQS